MDYSGYKNSSLFHSDFCSLTRRRAPVPPQLNLYFFFAFSLLEFKLYSRHTSPVTGPHIMSFLLVLPRCKFPFSTDTAVPGKKVCGALGFLRFLRFDLETSSIRLSCSSCGTGIKESCLLWSLLTGQAHISAQCAQRQTSMVKGQYHKTITTHIIISSHSTLLVGIGCLHRTIHTK